MPNASNIERQWEERSKKYKDSPEGVLPKSYPKTMNNNLHKLMFEMIDASIDKASFRAVDLGAGYGRLALEIVRKYPKSRVDGLDISMEYVKLFNKKMKGVGKAVKGDMRDLPFKDKTYDYVICVTTFLYMHTHEDQVKALSEMIRVLKPGGKVVLLERNTLGYKIVNLAGLVPLVRGKKYQEIESLNFSPYEIERLFKKVGAEVVSERGMPFWTITFFKHYFISRFVPFLAPTYYAISNYIDSRLWWFVSPSLYICYTAQKR